MGKKREIQEGRERDSTDLYKAAKEVADIHLTRVKADFERFKAELPAIREESEAIGSIKKIEYDLAHNQMLKYAVLFRIKKSKDYREGGMTWGQFCEAIGEAERTVDRTLADLRPLYDDFSAKLADLAGVNFTKIRYLGRAISGNLAEIEDGALVVDGVKISLKPENREEIEELIDNLRETSQKEKAELERRAELDKKRIERDKNAEIENLKVQLEGQIDMNRRLKVFDPEEKDRTWCEEQAHEVEKACLTFVVLCQKFIIDPRIKDDIHLQALANKWIDLSERALDDLRRRFEEAYSFALDA